MRSHNFIDLTGKTYGRLTVVKMLEIDKKIKWQTRCDCGKEKIATGIDLRSGDTKSCGCLKRESTTNRNISNAKRKGKTKLKEWSIWSAMMSRCYQPKTKHFKYYGGRGISVCERWHSGENFIEDMGPRPSDEHSLDRINNDGNYEPSNCRWATKLEQMNNRSNNKYFTLDGQTKTMAHWANVYQTTAANILGRIKLGWEPEDAIKIENWHRLRKIAYKAGFLAGQENEKNKQGNG